MTPPTDDTDTTTGDTVTDTQPQPDVAALRLLHQETRTPQPEQIAKLPKGGRKGADNVSCNICHGWHAPGAVHLDYMGHAELRDELLTRDPLWNWEPVAWTEDGLPLVKVNSGTASLWIRLTIHGYTRLGVGTCTPASKEEVLKELIGDALRNAAMSFGVAVTLWSKAEGVERRNPEDPPPADDGPVIGAGNGPAEDQAMGGAEPPADGTALTRDQIAEMGKPELVTRLGDLSLPTNGDLRTLKRRLWDAQGDGQPGAAQEPPSNPAGPETATEEPKAADPAPAPPEEVAPDDEPDPDPAPEASDEEQPPSPDMIHGRAGHKPMKGDVVDDWLRGSDLPTTGKVQERRDRLDDYLWGANGVMVERSDEPAATPQPEDDPATRPFDDDDPVDETPAAAEVWATLNNPSADAEEMEEMREFVTRLRDEISNLSSPAARAWATYRREKELPKADDMTWDMLAAAMSFVGGLLEEV